MGTAERRTAIMRLLSRRRHETIANMAREFDVSERTIRRDIEILSMTEPIYTQAGKYQGGVYVLDHYYADRTFLEDSEIHVLQKIYDTLKNNDPGKDSEIYITQLSAMINKYKKPEGKKIIGVSHCAGYANPCARLGKTI